MFTPEGRYEGQAAADVYKTYKIDLWVAAGD